MRCFIPFVLLFLFPALHTDAQSHDTWYSIHPEYSESTIEDRFFKQSDIKRILSELDQSQRIHLSLAGHSMEGREIYLVKVGNGPVDVLLWSQMHGDEPTATMATMDLLHFFTAEDEYDDWKKGILDELSLYFIPMLNPDGAQNFSRFNALGIDLNRDAIRLQCPESRILKNIRDSIEADFGFNLHDQSRYYSAGRSPHSASISFLAPAFNYEQEVDEVRGKAMRLIVGMEDMLSEYIPNRIAKFSDAFEPRAFGDNMQKWGTSTVLIEAGGLKGDREKQELRRLHFALLLHAYDAIANKTYESHSLEEYEAIPFNRQNHHDLLLRKVILERDENTYTVDLGFRRYRRFSRVTGRVYYVASLVDIGDLSTDHGYDTLGSGGYSIMRAGISSLRPSSLEDFNREQYLDEIRSGRPVFAMSDPPLISFELPCILSPDPHSTDFSLFRGGNPVFYLGKNGARTHLVANGLLFELDELESYFDEAR